MSQALKVAFIGLGVMGFPMAGHLSRKGLQVSVFNRTTSKAQDWLGSYSGTIAETPAAAAADAELIFTCVGNDDDLVAVTLGEQGALSAMKPGSVLVDHTTASAETARLLYEKLGQKQCGFIDAPVSGGQPGAINGQLTVMCGGDEAVFLKVKPVLDIYAKAVQLMGPAGSGQLTKMVNQICIGGLLQALAEGLNFASKAGLNPEKVIGVISKGAAQSWQMENRYKSMLDGFYEHGFAVDWMRKDFAICLSEARKVGASLPVTALVDQFYADVQQLGGGRYDTSSLLFRLQALSKKEIY